MKHPLLVAAAEAERQFEFDLDGVRKGLQRLSDQIDNIKKYGTEREQFAQLIRETAKLLGVSRSQVPVRLRKYL